MSAYDVTGKEYTKLCNNFAVDFGISKSKVEKMINKLLDNKVLLVFEEDSRTYWTTLQQFYNYEYKSWYRIKNNIASKKHYDSKKTTNESHDTNTITEQTVPLEFISEEVPYEQMSMIFDDENNVFY